MELAALYVSANEQSTQDEKAIFPEYIPRMTWGDNETILDVGCGPGDVTRDFLLPLLPSPPHRVVGVDVSQSMVDFAAKNFSHDSIEYRVLNIGTKENLKQIFPNGFTKIFSFYCLHWILDHIAWMKNLFTLLRPSGEVFLMLPADKPTVKTYEPMSQEPLWAPFMKDYTNYVSAYFKDKKPAELLARTAIEAGFEVVSCDEMKRTFDYKTIEHMRNLLMSVNPFVPRMPKGVKEEYVESMMNRIREANKKHNGSETVIHYTLLVAHLRKPM